MTVLFSARSTLNTKPCNLDWIRYIVCTQVLAHARTAHLEPSSSSPGIVIANTQSVGASLAVWAAAGILAWTGASSFAELGSSIPVNGGAQAYLAYAYGPLVSYLYTWTSIVLKPGVGAVIGLIFGMRASFVDFLGTNVVPQLNMSIVYCFILRQTRPRIASLTGQFRSPLSSL